MSLPPRSTFIFLPKYHLVWFTNRINALSAQSSRRSILWHTYGRPFSPISSTFTNVNNRFSNHAHSSPDQMESSRHSKLVMSDQRRIKKPSSSDEDGCSTYSPIATQNDDEPDPNSDHFSSTDFTQRYDSEQSDRYQSFYDLKENEFQQLSSETEQIIKENRDTDAMKAMMLKWRNFLSDFTPQLHRINYFCWKNPQYPPSGFVMSITFKAAEETEKILNHLLTSNQTKKLHPADEVFAYKIAMESWSHVPHPSSGDRCDDVFAMYGQKFGGDLEHKPRIDSFNILIKAHDKSCASYYRSENQNLKTTDDPSPAEKSIPFLKFLSCIFNTGSFLKPDLEFYSHSISVMRNTLLDWKLRQRTLDKETCTELTYEAMNTLNEMEAELKKVLNDNKGMNIPLDQHHFVIKAYGDAIAIASRVLFTNEETIKYTVDDLLQKLEALVSSQSENIVQAVYDTANDGTASQNLKEDIRRNIEQAFLNAIHSHLISLRSREPSTDINVALKASLNSEMILERMKVRSQESSLAANFLFPYPTQEHFSSCVECSSECLKYQYNTPESNVTMENLDEFPQIKVARLLKEVEEIQAKSAIMQPIDGLIYAKLIWVWSQVIHWESFRSQHTISFVASTMEGILRTTIWKYEKGLVNFYSHGDVTKMYNFIFRFYSKKMKGGEGFTKRALHLLDNMEYYYKKTDGKFGRPDSFTFQLVLKTISNSGVKSSSNAESILDRMQFFGLKPTEKHYLAVMRAYSRIGQKDDSDPHKTESILKLVKRQYQEDKSLKPSTSLFTACIRAYGGSSKYNTVAKILELSKELNDLYAATNDGDFQPDSVFYSTVLYALSRSKDESKLHHAFEILEDMEKNHDTGLIEAGPNRFAYTNVLNAIAQSKAENGVKLAEELMHRMIKRSNELNDESILPDRTTYTTFFQVLAKSNDTDAITLAEKWFAKMESEYAKGKSSMKPNIVTYTSMINCWCKSDRHDAPEKAERILACIEEEYEKGNYDVKPDTFIYGSIINTWCKSRSEEKATRAWALYKRMKMQYESGNIDLKPNIVVITSIITTCGNSKVTDIARQNALKVLVECISEIKNEDYISPISSTFRALLQAVKHIVCDNKRRQPISAAIFQLCCRNGQLDESVLDALQRVQPELYAKLPFILQDGSVEEKDIPPEWSRNVAKNRTR